MSIVDTVAYVLGVSATVEENYGRDEQSHRLGRTSSARSASLPRHTWFCTTHRESQRSSSGATAR